MADSTGAAGAGAAGAGGAGGPGADSTGAGGTGAGGTGAGEAAAWREQTRRAAAAHAAAHAERRAAEAAQARQLIAQFLADADRAGLAPGPLVARAYGGGATYRTRLRGWYLTPDRTIAIGSDGEFYILTVPASLRARFTGATVEPQPPPLIVNEGGRDGESMPLRELLRHRLHAGSDRS